MTKDLKIHVEVFIASRLLSAEQETFTSTDLRERVKSEFQDERPGVKTHISAHCIANIPLRGPTGYNYIWNVARDEYRIFQFTIDEPHPARVSVLTQPHIEDVPGKYHHLFERYAQQ